MAVKVHVEGPNVQPRVETTRHRRITVGAADGATVVIHGDPGIAPVHCGVTPASTGLELEPLEGEVRIGRDVVAGVVPIAYGDTVAIGHTRLRFQRDPLHLFPATWYRPPVPVPVDERSDHDLQLELLVAMRDAAGDPGPRMVYADWLEAAGYLEEAEQLRHAGSLDITGALQAEWRPRPTAGAIVGCYALDCPGRLERLARRPPRCGTCQKHVRACATTGDACAALAAGEPLAVDAALPRLTAELIDASVRRAAGPTWAVRRRTGEGSWAVTRPRGRVLEDAYQVVMIADRLELHFGGSDAGPYSLADSPRHDTVELPLAGLDETALVEWLAAAFVQLPPSALGYS